MISVVILSYNTKDITLNCLRSLYSSQNVEFETIVIDNNSSDGSADAIAKKFPKVKLTRNKENNGFAGGNNQGMKLARGDTMLLLNSDCFIEPTTLSSCLTALDRFDVVGCKLLNVDKTIQPSWGYFPTLRRAFQLMTFVDNFPIIRKFSDSIHVRDLSRYTSEQSVDWVTGAFVLLRSSAFKKTGGFDEKYFMYGEEMEWMYRMSKSGFKIGYYPQAQAIHLQGSSTKSEARMFASEMKGYLYWFSKHNSTLELLVLKFILIFGSLYKTVVWSAVGGMFGKPNRGKDNFETFKQILVAAFVPSKQ